MKTGKLQQPHHGLQNSCSEKEKAGSSYAVYFPNYRIPSYKCLALLKNICINVSVPVVVHDSNVLAPGSGEPVFNGLFRQLGHRIVVEILSAGSSCLFGCTPLSAPVSTRMSKNSSEASCGLFPMHVSAVCSWHGYGLDTNARSPYGVSMVEDGFKAMTPPD